jgi:acyl-coenzyme A synthetase/AMP-(fatty) acid ligase
VTLVEERVKALDFVHNCLVVPERHPQHFVSKQCILLVFISPKEHPLSEQKTDAWGRQINAQIKTEVGNTFVPDKILFYTLYPKMQKAEIDRHTVENQYRSGMLQHKQNLPIYRLLNLLKHTIYETLGKL